MMGMHLSLLWLSFRIMSQFWERIWEASVSACLTKPATKCILWNTKSVPCVLSVFLGQIVQMSSCLLRKIWLLCRPKQAKKSHLVNVKVEVCTGMCRSRTMQCLEKHKKNTSIILQTAEIRNYIFQGVFHSTVPLFFADVFHISPKRLLNLHIFHM